MVVDDALYMRVRCKNMLLNKGFFVLEAEDGQVAVSKYLEKHPEVVLMDITMPRMDGITAVKEIIKIDPAARIAMLSAVGQENMVLQALSAGAKDFILKPFEEDRLIQAVKKLIG